jgi:hypothetical protein
MSRLEVPLKQRTLRATGDTVLRADLVLSLKTSRGAWEEILFRVDSGTEMTTMPAYDAKSLDLPIPRRPVSNLVLFGHEVRAGVIRARVVGMDPTDFVFPCYFIGDPDIISLSPSHARNLLGLSGVINQICLTFDGRSSVRSPLGVLVVET